MQQQKTRINYAIVVKGTLEDFYQLKQYIEGNLSDSRIVYQRQGLPHEKLLIHKAGECKPNGGESRR
jgi:hypothetical protein